MKMKTYHRLGMVVIGLSLAVVVLCAAPADATIRHSFDWNGTVDGDPWPNPPWNHGFGSAHDNQGGAGHVLNTGTFDAQHAVAVPDDLDPNAIVNLPLVTFSFDVKNNSAVAPNQGGFFGALGFYVYDLRLPGDPNNPINGTSPNPNNDDAIGPGFFGNGTIGDRTIANPDVWTHYDLIMNASGAQAGTVANMQWKMYEDGAILQTGIIHNGTDPNTGVFGGFRDGFDTWGFKSFDTGEFNIDNFVVRDVAINIPEPSSLLLMGLCIGPAALWRRYRSDLR